MSGGHWDYSSYKIEDILGSIGNDRELNRRFPKLAYVFAQLAKILPTLEHDLDWDFSGDHSIKNDKEFEEKALMKLSKIIGNAKIIGSLKEKVNKFEKELDKMIENPELLNN